MAWLIVAIWWYLFDVMLRRDLVELGLSAVSLSGPRGHLINGHINNKLAYWFTKQRTLWLSDSWWGARSEKVESRRNYKQPKPRIVPLNSKLYWQKCRLSWGDVVANKKRRVWPLNDNQTFIIGLGDTAGKFITIEKFHISWYRYILVM